MAVVDSEHADFSKRVAGSAHDGDKENYGSGANSPTRRGAIEDPRSTNIVSPAVLRGSPLGKLEEAANRLRSESAAGFPISLPGRSEAASMSDRVRAEVDSSSRGQCNLRGLHAVRGDLISDFDAEQDSGAALGHNQSVAEVCEKFRLLGNALKQSNETQAELHEYLERSLEECERLRRAELEARQVCDEERGRLQRVQLEAKTAREECERMRNAEAELRRSRDHHHHRWCVLDQEREVLQRVAQQAREAESAARAAECRALEEAAAWRRWLVSFLDILLRRGATGFDADVSSSQCLQMRQPNVHKILLQLSQVADTPPPTLQPDLLNQLATLYGDMSELITSGQLTVRWGDDPHPSSGTDEKERVQRRQDEQEALERTKFLEQQLAQKELAVAQLEHEKRTLQSELRSLQNTVQELRGSIRVFCRIRPARRAPSGPMANAGIGARAESTQHVVLKKPPGDRRHEFSFDRVFPPDAGQTAVYEEVASLLPGVFSGLHLCIFAYGQTGAGKTHTLAGSGATGEQGIQHMAIADLLRLAEGRTQMGGAPYEARLSALEIYNESIQDLLVMSSSSGSGASDTARLELRQSREGLGDGDGSSPAISPFGSMKVPGLQMWEIGGMQDVDLALRSIASKRHVASTALNERSSRSHCILSLSLVQRSGESDGNKAAESAPHCVGVLHIVDLAGSERTKVSQAEGQQMKEANCINRSLSALADVLYSLGEGNTTHVPYRNSKLTTLMQDALGGVGCKTLLFAQVSPEPPDVHETYSTLTFAARVANIQKGRLRPQLSNGARRREATPPSRGANAPKGSPVLARDMSAPSLGRDTSPVRSQASDPAADTSLSSPVVGRGRRSTLSGRGGGSTR
mmetsp:Transcript_37871/g.69074  ORF Transcript_37871/g.69074 Transcript_37871/m.69074 type:complete len:864 (+) Transcript_37871:77-2668(+)